ncbi:uncharacterized protein [Musca autumnalis]|uniref:uncharacterized protein n=1 Tax=Musca autumnalis TaxID=221902 RepID=UPI003CF3CAC2
MNIHLILIFLFSYQFSNCVDGQKTELDLTNNEDHVFVVKLLLEKLSEVLNKTTQLDENVKTTNQRIAAMESNMQMMSQRIGRLEGQINTFSPRTQELDNRINGMNSRMVSFEGKLNTMSFINQRLDRVEQSLNFHDSGLN